MVNIDLIIKSLDNAILKCSPSSKIRSVGNSVTESTYTNSKGNNVTLYSYNDGSSIEVEDVVKTVNDDGYVYDVETTIFSKITVNGKEYKLTYGTSNDEHETDDFFNYQKEQIINDYGEEGWKFFCEYSNEFGQYQGWNLNSLLRGEKTRDDITDINGDFYISPFLLDNHNRFVDMIEHSRLDNEDNVTCRIVSGLHRNDSIGKLVVSDKGHTSTSTIGEIDHYDTYANPNTGWFIFTLNEKGSGSKGAFLGTAIREDYGYDFEREVNYAPNQKFERLLIDEKNRFIIQVPIE